MQKCLRVIGVIAVCLFGLTAMGYAAGESGAYEDIIDKIKVKAIHKIEVAKEGNFLDVTVRFENLNDKKIKFVNGKDFTFSVGTWEIISKKDKCPALWDESKIADDVKEIGREEHFDEKPELNKREAGGAPGITFIPFRIKMEDPKALDALKHLINCIGDPAKKQPFFPIKGKFELAIYSESKRGWTTARDLGIEWKFIPCIQDKVDFLPGN